VAEIKRAGLSKRHREKSVVSVIGKFGAREAVSDRLHVQ
jgi:hypothetical protein